MIVDNDLRERLAIAAHEEWASWMRVLFALCSSPTPEGHVIIDRCYVEQWVSLSVSTYQDLGDDEKNKMRKIADNYARVIEDEWPLGDSVGLPTVLEKLRSIGKTFSSEEIIHALKSEEPAVVDKGNYSLSFEDKISKTISWLHRRAYLSRLENDDTVNMWRMIR